MPSDRTNTERQRTFRQRQKEARAAAFVTGAPPAPPIPTMPSTARWKALQSQAQAALQAIVDEMEAYRDERSEQWQESDRAEQFQETLDAAEEARTTVAELTF